MMISRLPRAAAATTAAHRGQIKSTLAFVDRLRQASVRAECAALLLGAIFATAAEAKRDEGWFETMDFVMRAFWNDRQIQEDPAAVKGRKLLELLYKRLAHTAIRADFYEECVCCRSQQTMGALY
jgi:hypothetical protein